VLQLLRTCVETQQFLLTEVATLERKIQSLLNTLIMAEQNDEMNATINS
jgi:hypothetical protein